MDHVRDFVHRYVSAHDPVRVQVQLGPQDHGRDPDHGVNPLRCHDGRTSIGLGSPTPGQEHDPFTMSVTDDLSAGLTQAPFLEPLVHLEVLGRAREPTLQNHVPVRSACWRGLLTEGDPPVPARVPYELTGLFDTDPGIRVDRYLSLLPEQVNHRSGVIPTREQNRHSSQPLPVQVLVNPPVNQPLGIPHQPTHPVFSLGSGHSCHLLRGLAEIQRGPAGNRERDCSESTGVPNRHPVPVQQLGRLHWALSFRAASVSVLRTVSAVAQSAYRPTRVVLIFPDGLHQSATTS